MSSVVLSSKGQVVLPVEIRRRLGITAGTRLEVQEEADGVRLVVTKPTVLAKIETGAGMLRAESRGKPRSLTDFDAATVLRKHTAR